MRDEKYTEEKLNEFIARVNGSETLSLSVNFLRSFSKVHHPDPHNIAFIVVAHPTDTLPPFLHALTQVGLIAGVILKGRRIVRDLDDDSKKRLVVREIQRIYKEVIWDNLDRDILNGEVGADFLENLFNANESRKFIIIDHGGYFSGHLNGTLSQFSERCVGVVEHTLNGQDRYQEVYSEGVRQNGDDFSFPVPVYSIATTKFKQLEDVAVGESIHHAINTVFYDGFREDPSLVKKVVVIGYGHMGKGAAIPFAWKLAENGHTNGLYICDIDDEALALARNDFPNLLPENFLKGFIDEFGNLRPALVEADLIIVATNRRVLGAEHLQALKDKVCIAGVTSQDDLFFENAIHDSGFEFEESSTSHILARYVLRGQSDELVKSFLLAANGKTINFLVDSTRQAILYAVFAYVLLSTVELVNSHVDNLLERRKGVQFIDEDNYVRVLKEYTSIFGAEAIPDDSKLKRYQEWMAGSNIKLLLEQMRRWQEDVLYSPKFSVSNQNLTAEQCFQIGNTARLAYKDHRRALEYYARCARLDPVHPYIYSHRALSKRDLGDLKGALADLEVALSITKASELAWTQNWFNIIANELGPDGLFDVATTLQGEGNYARALRYYNKCIELSPEPHPYVYSCRAQVKSELGDIDGAVEDFAMVVRVADASFRPTATARLFQEIQRKSENTVQGMGRRHSFSG